MTAEEIEALAKKELEDGDEAVACVLYTLAGAMYVNAQGNLAEHVQVFSARMLVLLLTEGKA